jgi:hypothetical protein
VSERVDLVMKHSYRISRSPFKPDIPLEIEHGDEGPPCLWCGRTGFGPSMNGPLMCGACDRGRESDGTRSTSEQFEAKKKRYRESIAKYRVDNKTL